jgi:hypothetical protein
MYQQPLIRLRIFGAALSHVAVAQVNIAIDEVVDHLDGVGDVEFTQSALAQVA